MGAPIVSAAPGALAGGGPASGDGSRVAIGSTEDGVGNGRVRIFEGPRYVAPVGPAYTG